MAKPFRPKRGSTAQNNAFIGLPYELTLDRDRHSLRVHDGITAGGFEITPKDLNDARYIRTVNGQTPDATGNVEVQGGGGAGTVTSVNGVLPDATGNVEIETGNNEEILEAARRVADVEVDPAIAEVQNLQTAVARVEADLVSVVRTVNNVAPDANGNVNVSGGGTGTVTSVNGVGPDAGGNVTITIPDVPVQSVNGQTGDVVINIPDVPVQSVNGMTGTVVVDTGVMTVNGNAPDASGNVVVSVPDSGVQAVNGVGPDATGNVTVDVGVKTVNNATPDANGNVTTEQLGALPLTGGTMTGAITYNAENAYIQKADANGRLLLRGGSATDTDGARISLHGVGASTYPGAFLVLSRTADGTSTTLKGEGASLTWANKNIARSVNSVDADAAGNVAVDVGVKTVNGNAPDASGNITPAQTGCLPTVGGTMSGNVTFSHENVTLSKQDGNGRFTIRAGSTDGTDAASLALYGTGTGTFPGAFILSARKPDGTGGTALKGEDGALTWNGKHLVRSVNGVFADDAGNVSIATGGGGTASGVQTVNNIGPDASGNVTVDVGVKKVNNISPTNGNVTIDTGVMSVNGQTGTVTLDVGVTSVNGQSGAVTIDIPDVPVQSVNGQTGAVVIDTGVMSVNGQTGAVTIDIPDVPVQSVNGQTGDVTVDVGVTSVNGQSGAVTIDVGGVNDFKSKATNPVTSVDDDTVETWINIEAGVYRFDQTGCLADQPGQYGFLIHIVEGNSVYQQFKLQPSGAIYYRGGNSQGWRTTWRKLAVADATVASVNGMTGTVTLNVGVLTVNGNAPDANGNVSVAVSGGGVSTVNGQGPDGTGNVNIDVGVKKVNGISPTNGNVTIDTGVMSVNGQTGAVTIDIPDAPVTSVNGSTGDVTIDVGVKTINSVAPDASGNLALVTNDFVSKGTNIVSDVANDTTANWKVIEGGVYYFNQTGCLTDQPSQYGVLTHIVNGNNIYQQFKGLPSGALYYRSGTATGWSITWTKLATADATVASVNGNTGVVTALQTGCIPAVGNREQPAGYVKITNVFEPLTVTNDSLDYMMMGNRSAITVPDGTFSTAWVKRVGLNQANVTITLGDNWKWKGGVAPVTKAKSLLVLRWCTNFGVAEIVDDTPIDAGVMTVNNVAPTDGNVDIDVGALTVNGVSPDGTGNVTIPTGNSDEILEAARRVSIVDVDVNVATIQALQTAIASLEARISALENP